MASPYDEIPGELPMPATEASAPKPVTDTTSATGSGEAGGFSKINFFLEPLDPNVDRPLKDRVQLVVQSARSWYEFFDFSKFNIPPWSEWQLRMTTNIETFFYNYFIIAFVYFLLFSFTHFVSVVSLLCVLGAALYLFVLNPETIEVGSFEIDTNAKYIIVGVLGAVALLFGHALTVLFSVGVFTLLLVGVHGSIREHVE